MNSPLWTSDPRRAKALITPRLLDSFALHLEAGNVSETYCWIINYDLFVLLKPFLEVIQDTNFELLKPFLEKFAVQFPTGKEAQAC